jgi:tRNA A-37 threonylcarbamoyl transferase component Bud32
VKRYPRQLSRGQNNPVIAISENEVAKLFTGDTRSDIGSEAEKMQYANTVNGLVVKFVRLDRDETNNWDMLVMERLYPLDYRSYEVEKRELWFDVFTSELKQLHEAGFVHRDLRRPSDITGERFDNIFLTTNGLRLIDVGISFLKDHVGNKIFEAAMKKELEELEQFKIFFLNR